MAAKDISEELYSNIKKSFDAKYEKAQLLGEPLHNVFERIKSGNATFRDADMYAVEVGSMLSDALKEHMILDNMPNQTLYRNIAQKTIGTGLKDGYGLVSNISAVIQEEINNSAGIGIKVVKPKLEVGRVDSIVDKAVAAKSQEELDNVLTEPVETFTRQIVDDTQKANARLHNRAGLEVKVEREYDGVGLHDGTDACEWCINRAGTWTYDKAMAAGVFERHEGCGCIIDYTSKKGERTQSTEKYSGFKQIENPEEKERILSESEEADKIKKAKGTQTQPRYGEKAKYIDKDYIESDEYRMKYSGVTKEESVDAKIYEAAKEILYERDGTEKETLIVFDAKTGDRIIEIHAKTNREITYTEKERLALKQARDDGLELISLHNHAGGYPPSANDAVSALLKGYDKGLICGHNGIVYEYLPSQNVYDKEACKVIHDSIVDVYGLLWDIDKSWQTVFNKVGIYYRVL